MNAMGSAKPDSKLIETADALPKTPALFEKIVADLKIPEEFLARYSDALRMKFGEASRALKAGSLNDKGINQCLHVASCVALRQEPADLDSALHSIRDIISQKPELKDHDPERILTVATLHHLLVHDQFIVNDTEVLQVLRDIRQEFDAKNWLVGSSAMEALGIERVS